MSLKLKLATSISALFLVLAMLVTGVFAARNLEFNFGGTVNFEGVNGEIDALVTGTVTGTATPITLEDISIEQGTETVTVPLSWQNLDLNFGENNYITLKIVVQNRRSDRNLSATITMEGLTTREEQAGEDNVYGYIYTSTSPQLQSNLNLTPNQSDSFKFIIRVADKFAPVDNVNVTFTISLQDAEPTA